jgi:hypothetical protein
MAATGEINGIRDDDYARQRLSQPEGRTATDAFAETQFLFIEIVLERTSGLPHLRQRYSQLTGAIDQGTFLDCLLETFNIRSTSSSGKAFSWINLAAAIALRI